MDKEDKLKIALLKTVMCFCLKSDLHMLLQNTPLCQTCNYGEPLTVRLPRHCSGNGFLCESTVSRTVSSCWHLQHVGKGCGRRGGGNNVSILGSLGLNFKQYAFYPKQPGSDHMCVALWCDVFVCVCEILSGPQPPSVPVRQPIHTAAIELVDNSVC